MLTPEQRHRQGLEEHYPKVCLLAGESDHECDGDIQADHVIDKQRLKHVRFEAVRQHERNPGEIDLRTLSLAQTSPEWLVGDWRNGAWLCERAHAGKTSRAHLLPRELLPFSVEDFADEFGLEHELQHVTERRTL